MYRLETGNVYIYTHLNENQTIHSVSSGFKLLTSILINLILQLHIAVKASAQPTEPSPQP